MKFLINCVLVLTVFVSAVGIVSSQHKARKLFVEIQALEKTRDVLNEEWGKLQLEQSTWGTNDRIESLARTELSMVEPEPASLKLLMQ